MGTPSDDELVDAITAAFARVRGRRGPHGHADHARHHEAHHAAKPFGPMGGPGARGFGRGPGLGGQARFRLLEALAISDALTIGEIAEKVGVDQPRASRLVQQAQQMGFVEREVDPADARRTRVKLTDQGQRVARGFRGERRESFRNALAEFTDDERTEFARLLAKFAAAWPQPPR